jgi:eukaryotic-like serine/threonine-protein kinase
MGCSPSTNASGAGPPRNSSGPEAAENFPTRKGSLTSRHEESFLESSQKQRGYTFLRDLGQGAFATVFLARHPRHGLVAVKEISAHSSALSDSASNEVKVMRALDHVNIVGLVDHFRVGDSLVLVEEFCDGGDLRTATVAERPDEALVRGWMRQTLKALRYAHGRGVIHRDIKPANRRRGGGVQNLTI